MNRFLPKRKISLSEISLIPEAFFNLTIAWMQVRSMPSKNYLPHLGSSNSKPNSIRKYEKSREIAAVINGLSSRTIWTSTCLIKVLAAHKMLERRGISHLLHFGVKRSSDNKMEAHAWLSVSEEVLIGGENLEEFMEIKKAID
jgi:hypothetical protein